MALELISLNPIQYSHHGLYPTPTDIEDLKMNMEILKSI